MCDTPCDAPIDTHAAESSGTDSSETVHCARCGHTFDANVADAHGWPVHAPALPGKQIFRLVYGLAKRPSFILRTRSGRDAATGSGPLRKRRPFGWLAGPELRRMLFAALVFLGVPAALIFFVVVVCAPKGDVDARRPVRAARPQPAKADRPNWLQKLRP
jgi:hypothetical protein